MNKHISTKTGAIVIVIFTLFIGGIIFVSGRFHNLSISEYRATPIPQKNNVASNQEITQPQPPERFTGSGCYEKAKMGEGYFDTLSKDFNLDEADSKVEYRNAEKGIFLEIPYNTKWGNKDCKVEPYTEFKQPGGDVLLRFGKPGGPWAGDEFSLTIFHQRNAEEIINEQSNIVGGEPSPNPRRKNISNKQVIIYDSYGMADFRMYEVIGEKYNYLFGIRFSQNNQPSQSEIKELEAIIASANIY